MLTTEIINDIKYSSNHKTALKTMYNKTGKYILEKDVESIAEKCFANEADKEINSVIIKSGSNPLKIMNYAFNGSFIKEIILPKNVNYLGEGVFANCLDLKEIKLSPNIEIIPKFTFLNDINLEKIVIPEGIKEIGENAFRNCTALKEVVLPNSLKVINDEVFRGCTSLRKITLPKDVTISLTALDKFYIENIYVDKETLEKMPQFKSIYEARIRNKELSLDELLESGKSLREISNIYKVNEINR